MMALIVFILKLAGIGLFMVAVVAFVRFLQGTAEDVTTHSEGNGRAEGFGFNFHRPSDGDEAEPDESASS